MSCGQELCHVGHAAVDLDPREWLALFTREVGDFRALVWKRRF